MRSPSPKPGYLEGTHNSTAETQIAHIWAPARQARSSRGGHLGMWGDLASGTRLSRGCIENSAGGKAACRISEFVYFKSLFFTYLWNYLTIGIMLLFLIQKISFFFFKLRKSGNFIRWAGMHLRNVFLCLIAAGRGWGSLPPPGGSTGICIRSSLCCDCDVGRPRARWQGQKWTDRQEPLFMVPTFQFVISAGRQSLESEIMRLQ